MAEHSFTIPGRLPGLNEMIRSARGNKYAAAKEKKRSDDWCAWYAKQARLPAIKKPVLVSFIWMEPDARRDVDNIAAGAKFILDALVHLGVLQNDSQKWVHGLSHVFGVTALKPHIVVTLEEVDDVA